MPYISHLLGVASLAIENGADEDQAIAALLHDAVEDQGGLPQPGAPLPLPSR
jgi:(p)ppGpp synthase/HD superfamily hydrolase